MVSVLDAERMCINIPPPRQFPIYNSEHKVIDLSDVRDNGAGVLVGKVW